jgi:hypothetical protein
MDFLFKFLLLFSVALAILYYFSAIRIRELAIMAAQKHCKQLDVQLLDQSVSLERVRLTKNIAHRLTIERKFGFEFTSTGDERYRGKLHMHGNRITDIAVQAHRIPDSVDAAATKSQQF